MLAACLIVTAGWSAWREWEQRRFVAVLKEVDADFLDPDTLSMAGTTTLRDRANRIFYWVRGRIRYGARNAVLIHFRKPVTPDWLESNRKSLTRYDNLDIAIPPAMIDGQILEFLAELPNLSSLTVFGGREFPDAPWPVNGGFPALKRITIHQSGWKPSGLSGLSRCPQLAEIKLPGELIDEELIREFCRCPQLKWLHVMNPDEGRMNALLAMQPSHRIRLEIYQPCIADKMLNIGIWIGVPLTPEDTARVEKSVAEAERIPIPSQ